jgi:hypothetical protein
MICIEIKSADREIYFFCGVRAFEVESRLFFRADDRRDLDPYFIKFYYIIFIVFIFIIQ